MYHPQGIILRDWCCYADFQSYVAKNALSYSNVQRIIIVLPQVHEYFSGFPIINYIYSQ